METAPRVIGPQAAKALTAIKLLIAPVTAATYLALWITAEYGRGDLVDSIEVFAVFAVAIGLSVWMPRTALGLALAVPLLQTVDLLKPPQSTSWPTAAAGGFVILFVAIFARGLTRWLGLAATVAMSALFAFTLAFPTESQPDKWGSWVGGGPTPGDPAPDALLLGLSALAVGVSAWLLGLALAWVIEVLRRDVEITDTKLEQADLDLRLADDRARISRDVHDSLAHSLAVIVSQAQGATALSASRPEIAGEALGTVADVARTALTDVRMLVERIQGDLDAVSPRATVADLPDLVEKMRALGMTIDLSVRGQALELTDSQQVAVYRIVQESLTNALKHSGSGARVTVGIDGEPAGLSVQVESEGGAPLVERTGRGVGIEGMKERARLAGGWLRAAQAGGHGDPRFVVTAFVPAPAFGGLGAAGGLDA